MGLLKFSPKGLRHLATLWADLSRIEKDRLDMTSLLRKLIKRNFPVTGVPIRHPWGEVDSAEDLDLYNHWTIRA